MAKNRVLVFLDNASIHQAKVVKAKVAELGLQVFTNVPYTPELNAAELFIMLHKAHMRRIMRYDR